MNTEILNEIHKDSMKDLPDIQIGDTVKLSLRITEGDKSRIQVFEGIVIAMKSSGYSASITVRKMSSGIGVERIVPLHSKMLEKIEVIKRGKVRKSKLYYMRGRVGKRALKVARSEFVDLPVVEKEEVVKEAEVDDTQVEEVVTVQETETAKVPSETKTEDAVVEDTTKTEVKDK